MFIIAEYFEQVFYHFKAQIYVPSALTAEHCDQMVYLWVSVDFQNKE
jgi:hypothetical protein